MYKKEFIRFKFYNCQLLKEHFEKMASKGWMLTKVSPKGICTYKKCTPEKKRFSVNYFVENTEVDSVKMETNGEMIEYFAKEGWKLRGVHVLTGGAIQIFCEDREDAKDISVKSENITDLIGVESKIKAFFMAVIMIFIIVMCFDYKLYDVMTNSYEFKSFLWNIYYAVIFAVIFVKNVAYLRELKKIKKSGLDIKPKSKIIKVINLKLIRFGMAVISIAVFKIAMWGFFKPAKEFEKFELTDVKGFAERFDNTEEADISEYSSLIDMDHNLGLSYWQEYLYDYYLDSNHTIRAEFNFYIDSFRFKAAYDYAVKSCFDNEKDNYFNIWYTGCFAEAYEVEELEKDGIKIFYAPEENVENTTHGIMWRRGKYLIYGDKKIIVLESDTELTENQMDIIIDSIKQNKK